MQPPPRTVEQHCCFIVADECFAVASDCVAEVIRDDRITRVPRSHDAVLGLLHLRGRIVPVIDMRRRLGFPPAASGSNRPHLVVRVADDWYSLLVDEMLDVAEVPAERIEQPLKTVVDPHHDGVTGVFAGPGRLVHFLDPERIVNALVRQREQVFSQTGSFA